MLPYLKHDQILNLINNGEKLIIANNIIYNITNYYSKHPGGNCILKKIITIDSKSSSRLIVENCDIDYNFHSKQSKKIWKKLAIGTLKEFSIYDCIINFFK